MRRSYPQASTSPNWTYSHRCSQSVHSLLLGPSWYDQSYTVPMPCSGLERLSPDPFMMLMMHYSASITSLASPDPIFTAFLTLALERSPHQAPGSPPQTVPFRTLPPHTPLTHFVRSINLKPCLSAGFRDIKKHQLPNNPPHVQSDWNVQNQANPLCQKTIHPSLSLMLLTNLTTIGEMAQKLTRFHLPMVLQECGKK